MFFFLSQMMLEESLGADERVIQSMAQKMVGLLGQDLDIDFASPNDGMYGGLGVLTFSVHEIMGRTGELKETSELLDRFLLDQACQKADLFQQRKLSFGSYDILGGIAGVVYYLLDCEEILNQPEEKLKLRDLILFLLGETNSSLSHKKKTTVSCNRTKDDETGTYQFRDGTWGCGPARRSGEGEETRNPGNVSGGSNLEIIRAV